MKKERVTRSQPQTAWLGLILVPLSGYRVVLDVDIIGTIIFHPLVDLNPIPARLVKSIGSPLIEIIMFLTSPHSICLSNQTKVKICSKQLAWPEEN